MPVFSWGSCTSARHAGSFDCLMTSLILITMDNGRGHCAWWQSCKVPNQTHRGIKKMKNVCSIKKIKICAEYQDMLPRPRLVYQVHLGWLTSLGLGSMSRYSAQILICITRHSHQARNMTTSRLWVNYQCAGLYPGLRTSPQCNVPAGIRPWDDSTLRVTSQCSNQFGQRVRPVSKRLEADWIFIPL